MSNILIYGNAPYVPSGYGTQAAALGRMLRKLGHKVAFATFHGLHGAPLTWDDCMVYPGSGEDPWAQDLMPAHYRHFGADLLITLMDAWVLDPGKLAGMNLAHWQPVDCDPLSALDRKVLDAAGGRPIAMSRFGQARLAEAGYEPLYAPHALDMTLWSPLEDRAGAREVLGMSDRFVIGLNAANQDPMRKGFGEQLAAFALFVKDHPDALMMIHSRAETRQGINLMNLIGNLGLQKHVTVGDQYQIAGGWVSEPQMVSWHGIPDVITNASYGEGFGLAILQAQACGTPVVVNDCSSMPELCGAGWKTACQPFWNRGHDSWWQLPLVDSIRDAYEKAYTGAAALREQARDFALAYDADTVTHECWEPILKELLP